MGSYSGHVVPVQLLPSSDHAPHGAQLMKSVPPHELAYVHLIPPGTGHGEPAAGSYGGHVGGGGQPEPASHQPPPVPSHTTSSDPPHGVGYKHFIAVVPQYDPIAGS